MSRSPYGYDPCDLTARGKDASELEPIQQADGNVTHLAVPLAQTDPLHGWSRKDLRRCIEADSVLFPVESILHRIELDLHRWDYTL
jgi:hypothetical protein